MMLQRLIVFIAVMVSLVGVAVNPTFVKKTYAQAFCQNCGATGGCDSGLFCTLGKCLPSRSISQVNGGCFSNSDCVQGAFCTGADGTTATTENMAAYCEKNNPALAPAGKCQPLPNTTMPPTYTCANRGGQCSTEQYGDAAGATCVGGKTIAQCGSSCWINPYNSTGTPSQGSWLGSCVTPKAIDQNACGTMGAKCCHSTAGGPSVAACKAGAPSTPNNLADPNCSCVGVAMGGNCSLNTDCVSGLCTAGKCAVSGGACVNLKGTGVTNYAQYCQQSSSIYCSYKTTTAGVEQSNDYCCPDANACAKLQTSTSKNSDNAYGASVPLDFCKQANPDDQVDCKECMGAMGENKKLWTAIGCIPTSAEGIVTSLLTVGIGMSGGVMILSILYGAFMYATSAGNPKAVEEAQKMISAAIVGFLFIVFSIAILEFVGMKIFVLPGFGN